MNAKPGWFSRLILCFRVAASVEQSEAGVEAGATLSLESGQWTEERASLLAQLEILERIKNEEMQNLKTSLIAEQQVSNKKNWATGILLLAPFELLSWVVGRCKSAGQEKSNFCNPVTFLT